MPETFIPEPEPTKTEVATKVAASVIAGQGIVRRTLLYVALAAIIVSPLPALAVIPLVLLMATDGGLA